MLIESAVALSVLLFFLLGVIQYGFILAGYITLRNAASVAARYATLSYPSPSTTQVQNVASQAVVPMLNPANIQSPIGVSDVNVGGVTAKQVEIQYLTPLFFPVVVLNQSGGRLTMRGVAVMR